MGQDPVRKTLTPSKEGWDALKSEYGLDIKFEEAIDIHFLGRRMHAIRIGALCADNLSLHRRAPTRRGP
jgi:hypothetical protein